jgi:hypothetical protein
MDGNTPVVADTERHVLLRGAPAMTYIEKSSAIYSQLANTAESPSHIVNMTNAQFSVMRRQAADIPQEVIDGGTYTDPATKAGVLIKSPWNMLVMRFAVHLKHAASGFSWNRMILHGTDSDGRGDVNKLAAMILPYLQPRSKYGGGTVWDGEENRMLEWGDHVVGKQLPVIATLPAAVAVPTGTKYFKVSGGYKVWSAGVSLASS